MKAPVNIRLTRGVLNNYSAAWSDAEYDYHVWIDRSGAPNTPFARKVIYCNKRATRGQRDHKVSRRDVERHPAVIKALQEIPAGAFDAADAAEAEKEAAKAAAWREAEIAELHQMAKRLGFKVIEGDGIPRDEKFP